MTDSEESGVTPEMRAALAAAGRLGAVASWKKTKDRSARTSNARAAMDAKFLVEAEGDPERAAELRKAYYARLAEKSAEARRAKRAAE